MIAFLLVLSGKPEVGGATGTGLSIQTNSATPNNITIGAGKKLTVNAGTIIGVDDMTPTAVNFTGGGTLSFAGFVSVVTPTPLTITSGSAGLGDVRRQ